MLSAIIIEDEIPAAERLRILLQECEVTLLASFDRASDALKWLSIHETDVVLVDISLPGMDGLTFVDKLNHTAKKIPAVIFTTAYEEHALRAFELAAVDYLLKPIRINRLRDALARVQSIFSEKAQDNTTASFSYFVVGSKRHIRKIPWQQALYLMAEDKVVWLYTSLGQHYELPNTLIYWEEELGNRAVRIHRNTLMMRHALDSLVRMDDLGDGTERWGAKVVDSDEILPISRRQLALLRREMGL